MQNKAQCFFIGKNGNKPDLHKVAENHTALYKKPKAEPTKSAPRLIANYLISFEVIKNLLKNFFLYIKLNITKTQSTK